MSSEQLFPDLIQLTGDSVGKDDNGAQMKLLEEYFGRLLESGHTPATITLDGEAVMLIVASSPLLEQFRMLEERGTLIIADSLSMNKFGEWDKVEVGVVGEKVDFDEAQKKAKVIKSL